MNEGPRFKPLTEGTMTDTQRKAVEEIASGPRGRFNPGGPNSILLRSPELMSRSQKVGAYLRYESALPRRLNEFAILITARYCSAQLAWVEHRPLAIKAGLDAALADDLAAGMRPRAMQDDEAAIYQFCTELHETKRVSDAAFKAVADRFGERGVIDLIAVSGYYTMMSMVINVAREPLPGGLAPPLQPLR